MAATLAVVDLGDGTGATATMSGSSGGANVVYCQQVSGQVGAVSWTGAGARTGDGTLTLSLAKGYYFAYCLTDGNSISNLVYFQVTDSADAVVTRCFNAVMATLQLLNKPYTQRVYDSQYADDLLVQHPCTLLTNEDLRQSDEAALNGTDYIGNPIYAQIIVHCVKFNNSMKNELRKCRQDVFRAFHNQRLSGVPESVVNKVEFGDMFHVSSNAPHAISELTIRCTTREVRGLGA